MSGHIFKFISYLCRKAPSVIITRKLEAKKARKYLVALERKYNGNLSTATFNKIVTSYSIYIPMVCDVFAGLRNTKTTVAEKERMLLYFICSSILDDFCDEKKFSQDKLHSICFKPEQYCAVEPDEKMFLYAHLKLKNYVEDQLYYDEVTREVFQSQIDSVQQFDPNISDEELKRITLNKGGYSVLLCQFYFDHKSESAERKCWFLLGVIIQFTNDLYDIYKDLQAGSITLPGRMTDTYTFRNYFMELVDALEKQVYMLPYSSKYKLNFLMDVTAICSFGSVAIHQLVALQGTKSTLPNLRQLPREALIVDMESRHNIWYCIRYTYTRSLEWRTKTLDEQIFPSTSGD